MVRSLESEVRGLDEKHINPVLLIQNGIFRYNYPLHKLHERRHPEFISGSIWQNINFLAPGAAASLKRSARIQRSTGTKFNSGFCLCASKNKINSSLFFWKAVAVVLRLCLAPLMLLLVEETSIRVYRV